jgi:hypothetical protein
MSFRDTEPILWRTNHITVRCQSEFDSRPWHEEIGRIWSEELVVRPKLFNGTFLSVVSHDAANQDITGSSGDNSPRAITVETCLMEYRTFLAKQRNPALPFVIQPIGVSGITICQEGGVEYLVFARRSDDVMQYPGALELVPSGNMSHPRAALGVDENVPFRHYLKQEFHEELGLDVSTITSLDDIALVFDKPSSTFDVACIIRTSASREDILQGVARGDEYGEVVFVPRGEAEDFVWQCQREEIRMVPVSARLVSAYLASLLS